MEKEEKGGARCKAQCLPQCLPNRRRTPTRWMSRRSLRSSRVTTAMMWRLRWRSCEAARTVEQVVDVSAGRYGTAVTYGPGQRVTGIVLRRSAPSGTATSAAPSFVVEAHLVVATAAVTVLTAPPLAAPKTAREKRQRPQTTTARSASDPPRAPVLLRIADEARRALAATLRRLRPGETWEIDITIDELRDTDARDSSRVQ